MPSWQRTLALMAGVQYTSALAFSIIFPFLPLYVKQLARHASFNSVRADNCCAGTRYLLTAQRGRCIIESALCGARRCAAIVAGRRPRPPAFRVGA